MDGWGRQLTSLVSLSEVGTCCIFGLTMLWLGLDMIEKNGNLKQYQKFKVYSLKEFEIWNGYSKAYFAQ